MPTIWCANDTIHVQKTKIGKNPTYPKRKRRINHILATFLTDTSLISFYENDYLCTSCYERATQNFNHMYGVKDLSPMDTNKSQSARAAASAASSTISILATADMSLSDRDDSSSESSNEEIMNFESQLNRENSLELLNSVFSIVGQTAIRDIRNRNIIRQKVNDALAVIRQAAELVYKDNEKTEEKSQIDNASEITMDDTVELINNFKSLIDVSDYSEKIRLLTLVPKSWGRLKIANFFPCSDHQARYSIYLRDAGQVLSLPIDLRGNIVFDPIIEKQIFDFFHTDEISRASPNKKDILQNNKDPKPIRYMLMTLMEAYQKFIEENSSMRVGKSKFSSLKPKWVKTTTPHDTCACEYHQNPDLLLNVLNRLISSRSDLSSLVKVMICEDATISCYSRECLNCNNNFPSSFFIEQFKMNGVNEDDDVTWMIWDRNERRTELQRHTTSINTLLEKFDSLWAKFLIHYFVTIEQREYIKRIKLECSEKGTAVIQLDFAENFALLSQSAVQSSYWGQKQATIFTVHVKMGLGHRNLAFISDYMKHTTEFVYQAQIMIVDFIKKWYPNVKHL